MEQEKKRCRWCNLANPVYVAYHDKEWGVPVHDDGKLFEMLLLESFQAGLSWECILNKREALRAAFDRFDYRRIARYRGEKLQTLLEDKGIIRNRQKIQAAVINAHAFLAIQQEYGSFDRYIWRFTEGRTLHEVGPVSSPLSDRISQDLYRRGMRFVGSKIIYAYLQAIGIIQAHEADCWRAASD